MGLGNSKAVVTPGEDETEEEGEKCDEWHATKYKSLVARANYVAPDRPDVQYAVKELCRAMSRPTARYWGRLKRLGRYLHGARRPIQEFPYQARVDQLEVLSDANWGGCRKNRKSTSGGVVRIGNHTIKT